MFSFFNRKIIVTIFFILGSILLSLVVYKYQTNKIYSLIERNTKYEILLKQCDNKVKYLEKENLKNVKKYERIIKDYTNNIKGCKDENEFYIKKYNKILKKYILLEKEYEKLKEDFHNYKNSYCDVSKRKKYLSTIKEKVRKIENMIKDNNDSFNKNDIIKEDKDLFFIKIVDE